MRYLRLKKRSDFEKIFKKGKRAFSFTLTMIYRPAEKTTMGISIGKRHGKSVQRNRIKRLIREAFRHSVEHMQGSYDIVLLPKVRDEYAYESFKRDLLCMIKKEKL